MLFVFNVLPVFNVFRQIVALTIYYDLKNYRKGFEKIDSCLSLHPVLNEYSKNNRRSRSSVGRAIHF